MSLLSFYPIWTEISIKGLACLFVSTKRAGSFGFGPKIIAPCSCGDVERRKRIADCKNNRRLAQLTVTLTAALLYLLCFSQHFRADTKHSYVIGLILRDMFLYKDQVWLNTLNTRFVINCLLISGSEELLSECIQLLLLLSLQIGSSLLWMLFFSKSGNKSSLIIYENPANKNISLG